MKKIVMAILLSLSAAALTGCTDFQNPVVVSQIPESNIQDSSETESSVETTVSEKSTEEKSESQTSADEKSVDDEKSADSESSIDETSVKNESSDDEKSADSERSDDEKSDSETSEETENSDDEKSDDNENSADDETSDGENSDTDISDEESREDESILSFKIRLNDVEYTLPFDYAELEDMGYRLNRDGELSPETYSRSVDWKDEEGHTISTQLWNPTDKPQDYEDCKIGSIEIKLGEELDVVLPGEFSFDMNVTPELVKEQYGEPESEHSYDKYVTLRYKKDLGSTVEFFLYTDEALTKYSSVTVKNFS